MKFQTTDPVSSPFGVLYKRCIVDLSRGAISFADIPCRNLEDVLGGFGRSFQDLAERKIEAAYCAENPLIVNTGLLTGSTAITALRTTNTIGKGGYWKGQKVVEKPINLELPLDLPEFGSVSRKRGSQML